MIERYCDACGTRMSEPRYIKEKVNIGDAKEVLVHAYTSSHDLCQGCLVAAVIAAKASR